MVLSVTLCLFLFSHQISTSPTPRAGEGILHSGGDGGTTVVEVFNPSTGLSCSFPNLPEGRIYHTMNGLVVCGGGPSSKTSCLTFTSGEWVLSHTLVDQRMVHVSWQRDEGVLLMGGGYRSSEMVTTGVDHGVESFAMHYDTRNACAMPDLTSDSLIVTGGYETKQTVSRYDSNGFVEDLPSLVVGRAYHSCGSYLRGDGTQVLLVAGGDNMAWILPNHQLASTEVLIGDTTAWALTTPLPRALTGIKGLSLGGRVYMTGGTDVENDIRDEVFVWLDEEQVWEEAGRLKTPKSIHAVTTIQMDDPAMEYCS